MSSCLCAFLPFDVCRKFIQGEIKVSYAGGETRALKLFVNWEVSTRSGTMQMQSHGKLSNASQHNNRTGKLCQWRTLVDLPRIQLRSLLRWRDRVRGEYGAHNITGTCQTLNRSPRAIAD